MTEVKAPGRGRMGEGEKMVAVHPSEVAATEGAKRAHTDYAVLSALGGRVSWVAMVPVTGRTHQLRAHMRALGHPIIGDPKYGEAFSADLSEGLMLQLHHRRIELEHPTGGKLIVEAPISREMKAGFDRFGFAPDEAEEDPFAHLRKRK